MEFEFDPKKSGSNKQKHGIDFYEAQALWDDPDLIEILVKTIDEPRASGHRQNSGEILVGSNYLQGREDKDYLRMTV